MQKLVSKKILDQLSLKALGSPRLRQNYNFHDDLADPINRMLNAFEPGTYIQPHKHQNPDKREVFIVMRGSMVVIFFSDSGNPTDFILLNSEIGNMAVEIPPGVWHTIIALESGSIVYEVKDGPYLPMNDKNFASWAPKEGSVECGEYLKMLTDQYYKR